MSKEPKYVKNTLGKGEEIKWVAELNWIVWVGPILWFIIGLLFCAAPNKIPGIAIILGSLWAYWSWKKTEYVVTNKRVIAKRGIIAVKTEELRNAKVESVYIKQGILERLFNCGTVVFGGTGGSKVSFRYIGDPRQIKTHLEEIIDENK